MDFMLPKERLPGLASAQARYLAKRLLLLKDEKISCLCPNEFQAKLTIKRLLKYIPEGEILSKDEFSIVMENTNTVTVKYEKGDTSKSRNILTYLPIDYNPDL